MRVGKGGDGVYRRERARKRGRVLPCSAAVERSERRDCSLCLWEKSVDITTARKR